MAAPLPHAAEILNPRNNPRSKAKCSMQKLINIIEVTAYLSVTLGQLVSAPFYTDMASNSSIWLFLIAQESPSCAPKKELPHFSFAFPQQSLLCASSSLTLLFYFFNMIDQQSILSVSLFSPVLARHFTFSTTDLKPRAEMRRSQEQKKKGSGRKSCNPFRPSLFHDWCVLCSNSKEATENCLKLPRSKEHH